MLALQNIGRKKTQHVFTGAIDDDLTIHHLRGYVLREFCRVEFDPQHKPHSSHFLDGRVCFGKGLKPRLEIVSCLANMFEEMRVADRIDYSDGDRTRKGPATKCRAMHPRSESGRGVFTAKHCSHWDTTRYGLGDCRHFRHDPVVL